MSRSDAATRRPRPARRSTAVARVLPLAWLAACVAGEAHAPRPDVPTAVAPPPERRDAFSAGEELRYRVALAGLPVGRATARVSPVSDGRLLVLEVEADADPRVAWLLSFRHRLATICDRASLRPRRAELELETGGDRRSCTAFFDHGGRRVLVRAGDPAIKGLFVVDARLALDALTLVYRLRALPPAAGHPRAAVVVFGTRRFGVEARALEDGPFDAAGGEPVPARRIEIALRESPDDAAPASPGGETDGEVHRFEAWLETGGDRRVLQLSRATPIGDLRLELLPATAR